MVIFVAVVVVTKENPAAAADDDADVVFLIEIEIDQGVVGVGSRSRSSICYRY